MIVVVVAVMICVGGFLATNLNHRHVMSATRRRVCDDRWLSFVALVVSVDVLLLRFFSGEALADEAKRVDDQSFGGRDRADEEGEAGGDDDVLVAVLAVERAFGQHGEDGADEVEQHDDAAEDEILARRVRADDEAISFKITRIPTNISSAAKPFEKKQAEKFLQSDEIFVIFV